MVSGFHGSSQIDIIHYSNGRCDAFIEYNDEEIDSIKDRSIDETVKFIEEKVKQ